MSNRESPYKMADRQLASRIRYNLRKAIERLQTQDVDPVYLESFKGQALKLCSITNELTLDKDEPFDEPPRHVCQNDEDQHRWVLSLFTDKIFCIECGQEKTQ